MGWSYEGRLRFHELQEFVVKQRGMHRELEEEIMKKIAQKHNRGKRGNQAGVEAGGRMKKRVKSLKKIHYNLDGSVWEG